MSRVLAAAAAPPSPRNGRRPSERARALGRPLLAAIVWSVALCWATLLLQGRSRGDADDDAAYREFFLPALLSAPQVAPSSPAVRFPLPRERWLADVDTQSYARCGQHKCAYESLTNRRLDDDGDDDARYGYVLSQPSRINSYRPQFEEVRRAWEKARELSAAYGIRHLSLAEPWEAELTEVLASKLNSCPWGGALQKVRNGSGRLKEKYYATGTVLYDKARNESYTLPPLTIQPIQIVPEGSIMFFCQERRLKEVVEVQSLTAENLAKALKQRKTRMQSSAAVDLREFEARLQFDFNATVTMMTDAHGPGTCLFQDFQVMIDPIGGGIYHFDFDRCDLWKDWKDWQSKKTYRHKCLANLETYKLNLLGLRKEESASKPPPDDITEE